MGKNSGNPDWVIDGRLRSANSRWGRTNIGKLRAGIQEYIMLALFQERQRQEAAGAEVTGKLQPADIPCPPFAEWGNPPLPQPTRLRIYSPVGYASIQACIEGEFAAVQQEMAVPAIPTQPEDHEHDISA